MMKSAKLISWVINPFLVSFAVIFLLSFQATGTAAEALKWLGIGIGLSVLPVFIIIYALVRLGRLDGLFINSRQQRKKIYWIVIFWSVVANTILYLLGVPEILLAAFISGFSCMVVFMIINQFWKISLHTGFITGAVVILVLVYGAIGAISLVLIPAVAWARITEKRHTAPQAFFGMLIAAVLVTLVFLLFGLV